MTTYPPGNSHIPLSQGTFESMVSELPQVWYVSVPWRAYTQFNVDEFVTNRCNNIIILKSLFDRYFPASLATVQLSAVAKTAGSGSKHCVYLKRCMVWTLQRISFATMHSSVAVRRPRSGRKLYSCFKKCQGLYQQNRWRFWRFSISHLMWLLIMEWLVPAKKPLNGSWLWVFWYKWPWRQSDAASSLTVRRSVLARKGILLLKWICSKVLDCFDSC